MRVLSLQQRNRKEKIITLRKINLAFATQTGIVAAFCKCGMPAPAIEMVRHESDTMVMEYIKRIFGGEDEWPACMGYDNMVKFSLESLYILILARRRILHSMRSCSFFFAFAGP